WRDGVWLKSFGYKRAPGSRYELCNRFPAVCSGIFNKLVGYNLIIPAIEIKTSMAIPCFHTIIKISSFSQINVYPCRMPIIKRIVEPQNGYRVGPGLPAGCRA